MSDETAYDWANNTTDDVTRPAEGRGGRVPHELAARMRDMTERTRHIVSDLNYVFDDMPLKCLRHLRANFRRLIRGKFDDGAGGKCIFALATEVLPETRRVVCRKSLTRFYGGDREAAHYQPARALVRLWDGHTTDSVVMARYGAGPRLTRSLLLKVLKRALRRRVAFLRSRRDQRTSAPSQPAERRLISVCG